MTLTDPNFATGQAIQPLPIAPIQINGALVRNAMVKSMQLDAQVGQHDQLQISVVMPILDSSVLLNQSFYLRYGTNPNYGYFYGYISNVAKPQSDSTSDSQLDLTALGFSSIMKMSPSRLFKKRNTSQILSEVLSAYRIGLSAQDHRFVHERLAQVGETDWEFVVRVASMAGFYVFPYSGALVMSHPIRALDSGVASQVYEKSSQLMDNKPLLEFLPAQRTDTTQEDFEPEFSYFTATGIQNNVPDVPAQRRMKLNDYVYSADYAQFITEGMHVMTGMYQTADVRLRGDASIRPGSVIGISTGRTSAAVDSFDGLWYVKFVSTYIDEKVYQTGLKVCRDKSRTPNTGTYMSFYNTQGFPTMSLGTDGVWVSSWRS